MDCFEGQTFFLPRNLLIEKWEKVIASKGNYFE